MLAPARARSTLFPARNMDRRAFIRVSARASAMVGALPLLYPPPLTPLPADEGALADIPLDEDDFALANFPVDVRIMDGETALTDWFPLRNDVPHLVIEKMQACTISHLECRANLAEWIPDQRVMHTFNLPLPGGPVIHEGDTLTVNFHADGILDLTA